MLYDQVDQILQAWIREWPDLEVAPMAVVGRISRASRHIERALQATYASFDLNTGEFDVLATLRRQGVPYHLSPTELLRTLMLSSGAMTNRIDRLEVLGLVVRGGDPTDRRGVLVMLTAKGQQVVEAALVAHVMSEERLLTSLSGSEREL